MTEETTLARRDEEMLARHEAPLARYEPLSQEDIEILRGTVCAELNDAELKFFLRVCAARRLNPLAGQIHAIKRKSGDSGEKKMTIQTSIDGFRLIAERTHRYCPGRESTFTYDKNGKLVSATSYVLKLAGGEWHEVAESARYDEFCQMYSGHPQRMWATMPHVMLSKVSEARCLRRAFPEELMGVYTDDEMAQAENQSRPPTVEAARALQRPESAPSYAAATIVPETEEARRERAVLILRAKLAEVTERYLWDRDDLDLARWQDYDFSVGTAEEIMEDAEALEVVLQIARRDQNREQEAAAAESPVCEVCGKALTKGQATVSKSAYNRWLCLAHQKQAREAARG